MIERWKAPERLLLCEQLEGPFDLPRFWSVQKGTTVEVCLSIEHDFTYEDLQRLATQMGSTHINVSTCTQGYYGDHDNAELIVQARPKKLRSYYYSEEGTREIMSNKAALDKEKVTAALLKQAEELGLKVSK